MLLLKHVFDMLLFKHVLLLLLKHVFDMLLLKYVLLLLFCLLKYFRVWDSITQQLLAKI